jgi:starch-binding outer membrane protein, SusD/RagB family
MLNTSTRGAGGAAPTRRTLTMVATGAALLLTGCDLDLTNPNSPTQEATVSSAEGLIALGVGLQNRFGDASGNLIYGAGLVTDELAAGLAALQGVRDTEVGIVGQGANVTNDLFDSEYRVIKTANDIILNADNVDISEGTRSGLVSIAYLFKAAAIGELVQAYPKIAIETVGTATPAYVDRDVALDYAIALLDTAAITFNATAPSAQFNTSVKSTGFDVLNTIYAYRARLQRIAGDNAGAIASANLVNRSVFSFLSHTPQAVNRVFNLSSTGSSSALPRDAVRLTAPAEYGPVIAYHITPAATAGFLQPVDAFARFTTASSPLPLYYPDEVLLIKAEALALTNDLPQAQAVLDSVRTDCPGLVATDPNACLPPLVGALTQAQLLTEIYTMRRYELFATGLRWEDARRRGLVGAASVAKRCWFPYPVGEKNGNPTNVPADLEGLDPPANNAACQP